MKRLWHVLYNGPDMKVCCLYDFQTGTYVGIKIETINFEKVQVGEQE